jgi:dihydroflavonol-4-reductase
MPAVRIPWILALLFVSMDNLVMGTILGREPFNPLEGVYMARYKMYVSSEKARRELRFNPRPADQALREALEYFRHEWRAESARNSITNLRTTAT